MRNRFVLILKILAENNSIMKRRGILFCVAMVLLAQPFAIKADGFDWDWSQAIQIEALVQLHKKRIMQRSMHCQK